MVNLGSIYWTVQVANAAAAAEQANQVQQEMGQTAEKANQANQAVNQSSQSMDRFGNTAENARGSSSRLRGTLGLLSTALFFLGGSLTTVLGISTSLTGVWATVAGVGSTVYGWLLAIGGYLPSLSAIWGGLVGTVQGFVSWLAAGSAGALAFAGTLGALLGLLGVAVLEWTGVLDVVRNFGQYLGGVLPGVARDAMLALISIFAGPLAVIGGFIAGFVQGTLQGGLVQGIAQGLASAREVMGVFAGAWSRLLTGAWDMVQGFLGRLSGVPGALRSFFSGLGTALGSRLRGAFNSIIPSRLSLPRITIGGGTIAGVDVPSVTIGGGSIDLPQLNTGGLIDQGGLAMLHAGEAVVPADVTQNVFGGGGGTPAPAGGGVTIQEVSIEIGDQSLDLRDMTRTDLRRLAEELAPELGREVENIIAPQ